MATGDDAIRLLQQIDAKLGILVGLLSMQQAHPVPAPPPNPWNGPPVSPHTPRQAQPEPPRVASDFDLDGKFGDPEVRAKSPRDWTGPTMAGKHFSECPPEYLDLVAERLEYFAGQNDLDPSQEMKDKARWNRLDASRARGWAARIRAGYTPRPRQDAAPMEAGDPGPFTDEIPF